MIDKLGTSPLAGALTVKEKSAALPAPGLEKETSSEAKAFYVGDEYIKAGERERTGLYRVERDENGDKKIFFDKIEKDKSQEVPETANSTKPEKNNQNKSLGSPENKEKKMGTVNTDAVDREIEALKRKREDLKKELNTVKNGDESDKIDFLQRQLDLIEGELMQKDNDTYRKQRASYYD